MERAEIQKIIIEIQKKLDNYIDTLFYARKSIPMQYFSNLKASFSSFSILLKKPEIKKEELINQLNIISESADTTEKALMSEGNFAVMNFIVDIKRNILRLKKLLET
jgi:hypothetical protein